MQSAPSAEIPQVAGHPFPPSPGHLAWLLDPTSPESFFADYWQEKPLFLQRRQPHFYDPIFSPTDVWTVLTHGRFQADELFAVKDGRQAPGYLRDDGTVNVAKIRSVVEEKDFTLKLMNPEVRHPSLASCCHHLERQFAAPTTVGLFLTPPSAVGVTVHFDAVDVLVLQIDGQKVWRVYEPVLKLPSEIGDRIDVEHLVGEPLLEAVLEPGDFLYVPRGFPHEPFTRDSSSLHLSLGVEPVVWSDLLRAGLQHVRGRQEALRRRVPLDWLRHGDLDETAEQTFRTMLAELLETMDLSTALGELRSQLLDTLHKDPLTATRPILRRDELTLATWVRRCSPVTPQVEILDGKVRLSFHGGAIQGPAGLEKAFRYIASHERFQISDLGRNVSDKSKLTLVRRLVREGLLAPDEAKHIETVKEPSGS